MGDSSPATDRHHGLVDQGQTLRHIALVDDGAALQVPREGNQVGVTGVTADRGCLGRSSPSRCVVTHRELLERDRNQQVAVLGTLLLVLQETVGPGEPAASLRDVSSGAEVERQPERAPRGPPGIAILDMPLVRTLQRP
jgi:hypothetical protein